MGSATGVDISPRGHGGLRSRRLLRLVSDDRLVQQIRRGSEAAFEVAFERHAPAILGYCRHMLGSPEEAEDAVQHTFAAAYGDLQRDGERTIALKPWLFTIARNRCLSLLRARREQAAEEPELVTTGLAEQVERRAELRQLLADVQELPEQQREALLLAELGDLPQSDIARVLGCEVSRVKGLVYRARSALIARRDARELPCQQVREQLSTLRGGSLRRAELRLHLRECPGCRAFRADVRKQRQMLSVALPAVPTLGLKASVLTAVGASAGGGGAAAAGLFGGGSVVAKVAVAGALAVGGGTAAVVAERDAQPQRPDPAQQAAPAPTPDAAPTTRSSTPAPGARGVGRVSPSNEGRKRPTPGRGGERGRGPIAAPPSETPVRRGPPEGKGKPEHAGPPPEAKAPGTGKPPPAARGNGKAQGRANGNGQAQGQAQGKAKGQTEQKAASPQSEAQAEPEEPDPAADPGPVAGQGKGNGGGQENGTPG